MILVLPVIKDLLVFIWLWIYNFHFFFTDIVFLRTWVAVSVPQFCITVTSLLLPPGQKAKWEGMRTLGKLRHDKGLHAPVNEDSKYTVSNLVGYLKFYANFIHVSVLQYV